MGRDGVGWGGEGEGARKRGRASARALPSFACWFIDCFVYAGHAAPFFSPPHDKCSAALIYGAQRQTVLECFFGRGAILYTKNDENMRGGALLTALAIVAFVALVWLLCCFCVSRRWGRAERRSTRG